jgi:hypothetical protein
VLTFWPYVWQLDPGHTYDEHLVLALKTGCDSPIEELNAPIATESEITDFLRLLKLIWWSDSSMIAIAVGSEVADSLRLLKLIWRSDSSMIAITAGSEVEDFYCR